MTIYYYNISYNYYDLEDPIIDGMTQKLYTMK